MFDSSRHFRFPIFAVLALALLFNTACERRPGLFPLSKEVPEISDPLYTEARTKKAQGDFDIALNQFLDLIRVRDDGAPESHLEVASIYLGKKCPAEAIYHLGEYQRLRPTSEKALIVKDQIRAATRMLITERLPGYAHDDKVAQDKINELTQRCKQLSRDSDILKKKNAQLQATIDIYKRKSPGTLPQGPVAQPQLLPPVAITPAIPPLPQPGVKVGVPSAHIVKRGDTLSRISAKTYGTSARWTDIYNANRDKLKDVSTPLQQGWVLRIPPP